MTRSAGGGINYTYDTYKNRLFSAGNVTYSYDANHNRIRKNEGNLTRQYEYDPENRLTRVLENGQEIGKYYYNPAAGLRMKKIEDGKTTVYVYHDSQPVYEETFNTTDQANLGAPAKKELHVYIQNFKVARYINGIIRYQLLDHLGSTRVETDAAGKPVTLVNYGAFGQAEGDNEYETNRINGDFEAGATLPAKWVRTDWSGDSARSTGAYLSSGGVNNSKCVKLETLKDSANALWWLKNGVPAAGDTKYEFAGYYKCLNTAATGARVSIRTLDASGNELDYLHLNLPNATSWSPFSFKFKTHPDAVKIQLLVRLHGKAGQAVLYDSVRLKLDSPVEADSYSYTGKNKDKATQLAYFGARYYDPEVGRFITEDPAKDGDNWFVYCRNNPLKYVDPTGMYYEATAVWGSTGWVLAGCDTVLPFGDIVYAVGVAGCAIYDTWVLIGDKIPAIIEWAKQTGVYGKIEIEQMAR